MGVEVEFQTALVTALKADATLMADIVGVYDVPPQESDSGSSTAFPFVSIGSVVLTGLDTSTVHGFSGVCRLHTWSAHRGRKECKTVQGLIYDALHQTPLTVTGFNNFYLARETTDSTQEIDTRLIHGICEYRVLIESA